MTSCRALCCGRWTRISEAGKLHLASTNGLNICILEGIHCELFRLNLPEGIPGKIVEDIIRQISRQP